MHKHLHDPFLNVNYFDKARVIIELWSLSTIEIKGKLGV